MYSIERSLSSILSKGKSHVFNTERSPLINSLKESTVGNSFKYFPAGTSYWCIPIILNK